MTGYTAKLLEKNQNFQEFTLMCAHAFLVETQDYGVDCPIPDEVKPRDYYINAMQKAQNEVIRLSAMSTDERETYGRKQIDEANQNQNKEKKKNDGNLAKLNVMLQQVNSWNPPTTEHQGLKKFMVNQLTESIRFEAYEPTPDIRTPQQAWTDSLEAEQHRIEYYKEEHVKEIKHIAQRNKWVQELKKSLKETECSQKKLSERKL